MSRERTTVVFVNDGIDDVKQIVCQLLQFTWVGKCALGVEHEFGDDGRNAARFLIGDSLTGCVKELIDCDFGR